MRRMRILTALAVVAATAALAPAAGADPVASASKTCSVGDSRSYGTTYVISISATNVTCRNAKRLIRAFHDCRPGRSGRCSSVKGYSCSERRNRGATQYDSNVTCRKGSKTVKHTYTQYT
jgi:hypothetical protein